MQFRKKAIVVDAEQYKKYGAPTKGVCEDPRCFDRHKMPHVHTIHKNQIMDIQVGDWIIAEADGKHFYPCKPNEFELTYDAVHPYDPSLN